MSIRSHRINTSLFLLFGQLLLILLMTACDIVHELRADVDLSKNSRSIDLSTSLDNYDYGKIIQSINEIAMNHGMECLSCVRNNLYRDYVIHGTSLKAIINDKTNTFSVELSEMSLSVASSQYRSLYRDINSKLKEIF
jgi:hypothetical protein